MSIARSPFRIPFTFLLILAAAAGNAEESPTFRPADPCPVAVPDDARCGHVSVAEDPARPDGRRLDLLVVVLPSTGPDRPESAVALLAGGPGDSATKMAGGAAIWLADIRPTHDLLLVDQRGTGGSHALRCPYQDEQRRTESYLEDFLNVGRIEECRRALETGADLELYTTPFAADDLEAVRRALGYSALDLMGFSYGTRLAQVYARRHPGHARTMVLAGPVSLDARMPFRMAKDFDAALEAMFAICQGRPECAEAFPDLHGDLERALARIDAGLDPVVIPGAGEPFSLTVNRPVFAQGLRYMLYHPAGQIRIPMTVHEAGAGNFRPFAEFVAGISSAFNTSASDGLYLSVTCSEDVERFDLREGREEARDTLLGEFRVNQQKAACALWPLGRLPEGYHRPVTVSTPTLLLVGENDPATPPAWGRGIAEHLSDALLIVVPEAGHEVSEGLVGVECLESLQKTFMVTGTLAGLDGACAVSARLPELVLAPDPEPVELAAEAMAELVGTYGDESVTLSIAIVDGGLQGSVMGRTFPLLPLSSERLRIEGAPPGFAIVLERDDTGAVVRAILEQGPESRMPLPRKE